MVRNKLQGCGNAAVQKKKKEELMQIANYIACLAFLLCSIATDPRGILIHVYVSMFILCCEQLNNRNKQIKISPREHNFSLLGVQQFDHKKKVPTIVNNNIVSQSIM